ncbi:general substrate transporter [Pavlovales sp. CCMP2436]|nr:general substrate transporter [Pavlovales sp. CCMP2436]
MKEEAREASRKGGTSASAFEAARTSRPVARALKLGVLLMLCQQLSGMNAVFFYSTSIFKTAGLASPAVGTLVCGIVNILATVAGMVLSDRAGRRPLLLVAMGGMIASALALTALLSAGATGPLLVAVVCVSISFFGIGLGGIPWAIGTEIFAPAVRPSGMALCATVNWTATALVGLLFPLMQRQLGTFCFLPFVGCLAVGFLLVNAELPETRGKTIAQVQAALNR